MTSVPDLKVLVWSAWPVQDVGFRNDMFCTVVRCRTLGGLSRLVNADFGRSGSSSVTSRGSVWMLAHARAHRRVFSSPAR